jgi:regulator of protease activity HflC (stomatin/prohibitin superfamily)
MPGGYAVFDSTLGVAAVVIVALVLIVLLLMVKVIKPNENGVLLLFGAYKATFPPGLCFVSPLARMVRVDMRPRSESAGPLPASASDGSPGTLSIRVQFRVVDAGKAVFGAPDLPKAIQNALTSALDAVLLAHPGPVLPDRASGLSEQIREETLSRTTKLGVEIGELALIVHDASPASEFPSGRRLT